MNSPSASMSKNGFEFIFPAIRGVQAGRAYYASMCPLHLVPRIFLFDEEDIAPELRAQRTLNKARIPGMTRYILENAEQYIFSALTASVDGELQFVPHGKDPAARDIGSLHIPMSARFVINDGQHRRAAIEGALVERPELGNESIAVVLFQDQGLKRAQQMFTDLNQHAVRPSRSLGLLYDHRNERALIAREVSDRAKVFSGRVEFEKSTLAARSAKLFTISAIESATRVLLANHQETPVEARIALACSYWDEVGKHIPEWKDVREKRLSTGEFRREYVCGHGLALSALGIAGRDLLAKHPKGWKTKLRALKKIDWSRRNSKVWEGRGLVGGRLSKSRVHVRLVASYLKRSLSLPLTPEELQTEQDAGFNDRGNRSR